MPPPFQRKLFATPMIFGYLPQLFWVICHTLNDRVSENISDEKLTNQSWKYYLPPPGGLVICIVILVHEIFKPPGGGK